MKAKHIKRITFFTICSLFLFTAAGCFVPEATAGFEGAAQPQGGQTVTSDITAQVNAPDRYENKWEDERFSAVADAEIALPDTSAMPHVRVEAADFTQDQINNIIGYLFPGETLYETEKPLTRTQIEEEVAWMESYISNESDPDIIEDYRNQIENLLKQAETATDESEYPVSDGLLQDNSYTYNSGQTVQDQSMSVFVNKNSEQYRFSVNNNSTIEGEADPYSDDVIDYVQSGANLSLERIRIDESQQYFYFGYYYPLDLPQEDVLAGGMDHVGISLDEALSFAEEFFTAAGAQMSAQQFDLATFENDWETAAEIAYDGEPMAEAAEEPALRNSETSYGEGAYYITFTRRVEGIDALYIPGSASMSANVQSGQFYQADWNYEYATVAISKNGVQAVNWYSPHTIGEVIPQTQTLLPFSDIAEIYENMLLVEYAQDYGYDEALNTMMFNTESAKLGYFRISDENSITSGTLVPAWGFYGRRVDMYEFDGNLEENQWHFDGPFLVINALDGSVIDMVKGY